MTGRIPIKVFVLALLVTFTLGVLGGFQYQSRRLPVSDPAPTQPQISGISLPGSTLDDEAVDEYLRAMVSIHARSAKGIAAGSGFLIDSQGHVVTAAHVVEGAINCVSVLDAVGRVHYGSVVAVGTEQDVALLNVPSLAEWPSYLKLGDSDALNLTDGVYVLGTPKGLDYPVSLEANVSRLHDEKTIDNRYFSDLIQTTGATVVEGTSGGALVEKTSGKVVGVVTAGSSGPLAWAVPINSVAKPLRTWATLSPTTPCKPVPIARTTDVYLAVVAPLSGEAAENGADLVSGVQLALRDLEDTLRAAGYEVTLQTYDDQNSPEVGREMAAMAAGNPSMIGLVGSLGNEVTAAVADELKGTGLVMVAPTAGADELTAQGWLHFNRLVANSHRMEQAAARFARRRLFMDRILILHDGTPEGQAQAARFQWAAQVIGLNVVGQIQYDAEVTMDQLRMDILSNTAEGIYFAGRGDQAFQLFRQMRQAGISMPLVGGATLFDARFQTLTSSIYQGAYFTRLTAEPSQAFQTHFENLVGRPTRGYAAYGYDAASLILASLIQYGEENPGKLPPREELARMVRGTTGYPGRTSWVSFDPKTGENRTSWVYIFEWRKGEPILLESLR